jgi:hypothetical protein
MFRYFLILLNIIFIFSACEAKVQDAESSTISDNSSDVTTIENTDEQINYNYSISFNLIFSEDVNLSQFDISKSTLSLNYNETLTKELIFIENNIIIEQQNIIFESLKTDINGTLKFYDQNNNILKEQNISVKFSELESKVTNFSIYIESLKDSNSLNLPSLLSLNISLPENYNCSQEEINLTVLMSFSHFDESFNFELTKDQNSSGNLVINEDLSNNSLELKITDEVLICNYEYHHILSIYSDSESEKKQFNILINIPYLTTGKSIDGYTANSKVEIKSLENGEIIAQTETDSTGSFVISQVNSENLLVEISGGIDTFTQENFNGILKNILTQDNKNSSLNVSPISSIVATLFENGETLSSAENIVANSFDLDIETLRQDPIASLTTNSESSSKMMKAIFQLETISQIISTVSSDKNSTYLNFFKQVGLMAKENNKIEDILKSDSVDLILDKLISENNDSMEQVKINSIRDLVKNSSKILDEIDINQNNLNELINIQQSIETFKKPLSEKLQEIQTLNNEADVLAFSEDAEKIVNATIALGGIDYIQTKIENNETVLTQDEIDEKWQEYDEAINNGTTTEELLSSNNSEDLIINDLIYPPNPQDEENSTSAPNPNLDYNNSSILPPQNIDSPPTTEDVDSNSSTPSSIPDLN